MSKEFGVQKISGSTATAVSIRTTYFPTKVEAFKEAEEYRQSLATGQRVLRGVPIRRYGRLYVVGP